MKNLCSAFYLDEDLQNLFMDDLFHVFIFSVVISFYRGSCHIHMHTRERESDIYGKNWMLLSFDKCHIIIKAAPNSKNFISTCPAGCESKTQNKIVIFYTGSLSITSNLQSKFQQNHINHLLNMGTLSSTPPWLPLITIVTLTKLH